MPYLSIQTSQQLDDPQSEALLQKASKTVSELLGKSENYVMVALDAKTPMSFAGNTEPTAYLMLKSLGLPEDATSKFSEALCSFISTELNIDPARIYLEFSGPDRHMWGWNNKTF